MEPYFNQINNTNNFGGDVDDIDEMSEMIDDGSKFVYTSEEEDEVKEVTEISNHGKL